MSAVYEMQEIVSLEDIISKYWIICEEYVVYCPQPDTIIEKEFILPQNVNEVRLFRLENYKL